MNSRRSRLLPKIQEATGIYDWWLVGIMGILIIGGLSFLSSALATKSTELYQREFFQQILYGLWFGGIACFVLAKFDYHNLFKFKNIILWSTVSSLVFLAIFVLWGQIAGYSSLEVNSFIASFRSWPIRPFVANGSIRWIATPLSNFQPSEFARLALLIYVSAYLNDKPGDWSFQHLKRPMYAFLLVAFLVYIQPDQGSVVLTAAAIMSALWVAKLPLKFLTAASIVIIVSGSYFALSTSYRRDRIDTFFQGDCSSAAAYQVCQIQSAAANGGLWGLGYGNSEFKQRGAIPESTTDGIIAIIAEEMGFVFTIIFLSLYLFLLWRALIIARDAPDVGGRALATGIGVWIVTQAFWNIGSMVGLTPLKGLPLPFVSEGGSSMITILASCGLLLNISSQSDSKKLEFDAKKKENSLKSVKWSSRTRVSKIN